MLISKQPRAEFYLIGILVRFRDACGLRSIYERPCRKRNHQQLDKTCEATFSASIKSQDNFLSSVTRSDQLALPDEVRSDTISMKPHISSRMPDCAAGFQFALVARPLRILESEGLILILHLPSIFNAKKAQAGHARFSSDFDSLL